MAQRTVQLIIGQILTDEEFRSDPAPTRCVWCNRDAVTEAVWAKAY